MGKWRLVGGVIVLIIGWLSETDEVEGAVGTALWSSYIQKLNDGELFEDGA